MNVEHFLSFWSRYNTMIIEVLIGLILLTVVYLAFRLFFGGDEQAATAGAGTGALPTAELEKTLQKILENQSTPGAGGAAGEELVKLKSQIAEKEKQIEELKAAGSTAVAPAADAGAAETLAAEKKALEDKVKDLEARLAEYEIISEDIADLSFYKEENGKLQKELEALKAGGAVAAPPAAAAEPVPPPPVEPAPVVPEPPAADPLAEMAAAAEATPAPAAKDPLDELLAQNQPPVEPAAEPAPAPAEPSAVSTEAPPAAPEPPPAQPAPDDGKLMNQFADFVKKG